jgi:serine phosphatase RsbU (regulator of sigma subunit)
VEQVGDYGTLLGVVADPWLSDTVSDLETGDAVIFFTDGVEEARTSTGIMDRERFELLTASCVGCSAEEICDRILAEIGPERSDDIALLALRITGGSPDEPRDETTGHGPPE